MLKLKKYNKCSPIIVEFDPYIAVKIIFGESAYWLEPTIYWRTGDIKNQLIEIGIGKESDTIKEITLVDIKKITQKSFVFPGIQLTLGIPVFEKNPPTESRVVDEKGPLEMFIDSDKLQIIFSNNKITSGLRCERVTCLFDQNKNFCGIQVSEISSQEMEILKTNFIDRLCKSMKEK